MSKRGREEVSATGVVDINSAESKAMLQRMVSRARGDWPSVEDLNKKVEQTTATHAAAVAAADGKVPYMSPLADLLYLHHDRPHKDCRYEWWYVNGAFGRSKVDPRIKYSFFAAFFRLNALGDTYCHAVNWALVEERFEQDPQTGAERVVPGTSRYHTSSLMDPITPTLMLGMMKAGLLKFPSEHLTRQLRQIYEDNCVPSPDYIMRNRPEVYPDPYSFSPSPLLDDRTSSSCIPGDHTSVGSPLAEDMQLNTYELSLLHINMDGNSLKSTVDATKKCPATHALLPPVYQLHLGGEALSSNPDGTMNKANITLDIKYTPSTASPVLHGRNGVVAIGNMSEDDMFYYFTPQCQQLQNLAATGEEAEEGTTKLTIGDETIELMTTAEEKAYVERTYPNAAVRPAVSNAIWMDHEFGAAISETQSENALLEARKEFYMNNLEHQWEWAALQLEGLGSISLTVLKDAATGATDDMFGIFQPAVGAAADNKLWEAFHVNTATIADASAPQPIKFKSDDSVPIFTSLDTGKKFPNGWTAELPDFRFKTASGEYQGLSFVMRATFAGQEFITLPGKPSYWEGRITVVATPIKVISGGPIEAIRGTGFMECHGHVDPQAMDQLFMITKMMMFDPVKMAPKPSVFVDESTREQKLNLARSRHSTLAKEDANAIPVGALIPEDVAESFFDVLFAGDTSSDDLCRPGHNAIKALNTVLVAQQRVSAAFEAKMLPLVRPSIQLAMSMVPGPKPPAEHVEFLCKAVAVYSFLHHYYGPALVRKGDNGHPLVIAISEKEALEFASTVGGSSSGTRDAHPKVGATEEDALASYDVKREILWADVALGWLMREKRFLLTGTSGSHRMSGSDAARRNINPFKQPAKSTDGAVAADENIAPRESVLGPMPPRAGTKETVLCALVERAVEMLVVDLEKSFLAQPGTSLEKHYPFLLSKRHFHSIKDGSAPTPKKTSAAPSPLKPTTASGVSPSKKPAAASAHSHQRSSISEAARTFITIPEDESGIEKGTLRLPVPSDTALHIAATDDEIQRIKHDFTGLWSKSKTLGKTESISTFLAQQSVPMYIRMITANLSPDLDTYIDLESKCVSTKIITAAANLDMLTRVNGEEYSFESSGRGTMKCRACVYDNATNAGKNGKVGIVVAATVPSGPKGIEFKYISIVNCKEPILREVLVYYTQEQVDKKDFSTPTATYRQYFTKKQ